jgi:DNA repair protein RadC
MMADLTREGFSVLLLSCQSQTIDENAGKHGDKTHKGMK